MRSLTSHARPYGITRFTLPFPRRQCGVASFSKAHRPPGATSSELETRRVAAPGESVVRDFLQRAQDAAASYSGQTLPPRSVARVLQERSFFAEIGGIGILGVLAAVRRNQPERSVLIKEDSGSLNLEKLEPAVTGIFPRNTTRQAAAFRVHRMLHVVFVRRFPGSREGKLEPGKVLANVAVCLRFPNARAPSSLADPSNAGSNSRHS